VVAADVDQPDESGGRESAVQREPVGGAGGKRSRCRSVAVSGAFGVRFRGAERMPSGWDLQKKGTTLSASFTARRGGRKSRNTDLVTAFFKAVADQAI